MMNRLLDFRNKILEKEFRSTHHLSTTKSSRLINIIMGCLAITYTARYIADIIFNPFYNLTATIAGIGIIYAGISLFYLGRYIMKRFKLKNKTIDVIVLVVALLVIMLLNNPIRNPKQDCDPGYMIFWDCFEIGTFTMIITLQMRRWYHRSAYFALEAIYFAAVYQNTMYDRLMAIKIVGFIIMISFMFYYIEKSKRLGFLHNYNQEISTKHILNALPEGILIVDNTFQCLHFNPSLERMFPELEAEDKSSIENFMKSIIDPKQYFPDVKSQQYGGKIDLTQDKEKSERLGRSNSLFSEDGILSNNVVAENAKQINRNTVRQKFPYLPFKAPKAEKEDKEKEKDKDFAKKEELRAIRLDSNEANNTIPTAYSPCPTSLYTYVKSVFEKVQDNNKFSEQILKYFYFDAKHEDKSLEINLSYIDFLNKKCFLLIFRDKTYREHIEKLENTAKYKSHVLATVSHELRTPVTSSLHLLNAVMEQTEMPVHCVETFIKPASRVLVMMLNLINDILDYSQLKEEKLKVVFQPVDIRSMITEALSLIEIQAKKKGITLKLDLDPLLPSLFETDPNRFTQILLNLLSNALKFTSKGEIVVSAFMVPEDESQGLVKVSVRDTGIGIKEADLKKLFVEFEKIDLGDNQKMNSNGCGLGLNIANRLAKYLSRDELGGIKVKSQVGKGSTFYFVLDNKRRERNAYEYLSQKTSKSSLFRVSKASSFKGSRKMTEILDVSVHNITELKDGEDNVAQRVSKQSFARGSCKREDTVSVCTPIAAQDLQDNCLMVGPLSDENCESCTCPKILIVDDDAFNQLTLESMLTKLNYSTKSCFNGEEAVKEVIKRNEEKKCRGGCANFEYIFMDSNMPIMTGPEASKKIKQYLKDNSLKSIPIIGLSSYSIEFESNRSFLVGMDYYLPKPVIKEKLKEILWKAKERETSGA